MRPPLLPATLAAAVAALAVAAPAGACSCAPGDPRRTLMQADGAFVGVLLSKRVLAGGGDAVFTFRVEQVVKGRLVRGKLPRRFRVYSASNGAACGLEGARGTRMGLFVYLDRGRWTSNLCRQIAPAELRRAARPLPRPNGRGAATVLVGGSFGEARTMTLDSEGRTLAYGRGTGSTTSFAVCPGGSRVAELVSTPRGPYRIAIRTLPALALVRQVTLPRTPAFAPARCADAAGTRLVGPTSDDQGVTGIAELVGSSLRPLYQSNSSTAAVAGGHAYLVQRDELVRVDLATGARAVLGRVPPRTTRLVPSPDGRHVAAVVPPDLEADEEEPSEAVVVDVEQRTVRTASLGVVWEAEVQWLDTGRVAYVPLYTRAGALVVFDPGLARVGGFTGFEADAAAVVGTTAWGVASGTLTRAVLPGGPQRVVRRLPSPEVWALASAVAPGATAHRAPAVAAVPACPLGR